jgi:hypothetical protein
MASSKSDASNVSSQTTSTVTDSYNQTSNFTENFSNVGNTATTLHFGPESTGQPGETSLSSLLIPGALAAVALILFILRR